jgi:hypothetical protein
MQPAHRREVAMTNSNLWTYRDTLDVSGDVVGYNVEATDGSIGKIDEASTETSRRYLVVDTGFWIFGKKRLIPAGVVNRLDRDDRKVYVSMTKDQIKNAPDYDDRRTDRDDSYYEKHAGYYTDYDRR